MQSGQLGSVTPKEELLGSAEELVFGLGAGNWVEAPDTHDLSDCLAASIVGIRVCAENTAEVCFQPKFVGRLSFFAPLVDAVTLYGAGERGVYAHVDAGEGIVTAGMSIC